jgi:transposase
MSKRKVRSYTEEFRRSSAKLAIESKQPIAATARDLGINEVTLHGWVKRYSADKLQKTGNTQSNIDMLSELNRLKKENARLKMERDILKKATAYFASDTV